MPVLPPLTVAIPLFAAALLAATGWFLPKRVVAGVALAAAAATTAIEIVALLQSWPHPLDHWFGHWSVEHHFAVGILFTLDPIDGALACTVGLLIVAAFVFAVIAVDEVSHGFHVLMLAFLAGMSGFALSADLFDIFVFFELMSVCGYALCSFRNTSTTVINGALDFAIVNTVGAFFILAGIALIYGRTGALNLAQIAHDLQGHRPDALVVVSFVLIVVGLLVKAGAVPFHLWLSDAYSVAAAPVGVVYAGIMSDLGYHAIARIYADGYAGSITGDVLPALRDLLIGVGAVTVVVGAVMCFLQADLKRMLAFLVVSEGGVFLCGIGLVSAGGLAGATVGVVADGMAKGALFLVVGFVVAALGTSDELALRGRGRDRRFRVAAGLFLAAVVAMVVLPGTGSWLASALIVRAADAGGYGWLAPVLAAGVALKIGAFLRAGARVFLGWGPAHDASLTSQRPDEPEEGEPQEEDEPAGITPWALLPAGALLVGSLGLAAVPDIAGYALASGHHFLDLPSYVKEVLHGVPPRAAATLPGFAPGAGLWLFGAATTVAALLAGGFGLWWTRLPAIVRRLLRLLRPGVDRVKAIHSARIGDMVTWVTVGAVSLCAVALVTLRS